MTRRIQDLIASVAAREEDLKQQEFLAPRLEGGAIRVKMDGLVVTFDDLTPHDFEGWGIWRATSKRAAELIEPPGLPAVSRYLSALPGTTLWLSHEVGEQTWLATPGNTSDMQQRMGWAHPVTVRLVEYARPFDRVMARFDGRTWWFEQADMRADPQRAQALRDALEEDMLTADLRISGLVPEQRAAYDLALRTKYERLAEQMQDAAFREALRAGRRQRSRHSLVQRALEDAGGTLNEVIDRGDFWLVEWTAPDGWSSQSAVRKSDLSIISAGLCLSGEDRKFDLKSLVGVVEQRGWSY